MASIYDLKPKFQEFLRPTAQKLADRGYTANDVTIGACALSVVTGLLIAALAPYSMAAFLLLPFVLFVRMALNAIDGMLAREHNMKSSLGAILNEVGDVVSDTALYSSFLVIPDVNGPILFLVIFFAILSEFVGILAAALGAGRRYDGPMGKSDRAVVFGALGLLIGLGVSPYFWVNSALALTGALLVRTIFKRGEAAVQVSA